MTNMYTFRRLSGRIIDLQEGRYIRIRTYAIQGPSLNRHAKERLLGDLLASPVFDDWLVGPEEAGLSANLNRQEPKSEVRHGPFLLDKIRTEHYAPLTLSDLAARLEEHFEDAFYLKNNYGPVPEASKSEVVDFLDPFGPDQTDCYRLVLKIGPEREEGYMAETIILSEFEEYVLVDRERNMLHLLIIGFD